MKQPTQITVVLGLVFVFIASACAVPPKPIPTPPPLNLVKAFQNSWNQQDAAGVLTLFADNPTWAWGYTLSSKNAIGNFIEYSTQLKGLWAFGDCQSAEGAVTCKAEYSDDCFPLTVGSFHTHLTFEFLGSKIARVAGAVDPNEDAAFEKRHVVMLSWAAKNLPADYATYVDPNEWLKFTGTGDQPSGMLTVSKFGEVVDRICGSFTEALQ